jgi:hypothetical protein
VNGLFNFGFELEHVSLACTPATREQQFHSHRSSDSIAGRISAARESGSVVEAIACGLEETGLHTHGGEPVLGVGALFEPDGEIPTSLIDLLVLCGEPAETAQNVDKAMERGALVITVEERQHNENQNRAEAENLFRLIIAEALPRRSESTETTQSPPR